MPSPTFLALVVAAVEQVIAAEHTAMSTPASSSVAGGVPLHSRPACSPKLRPWQLPGWAFHQCRLLSPERLTKCKPHSLLSQQLRHCRHSSSPGSCISTPIGNRSTSSWMGFVTGLNLASPIPNAGFDTWLPALLATRLVISRIY